MLRIARALVILLVVVGLPGAAFGQTTDSDWTFEAVPLRDGVTADIHAKVFVNADHACQANSVVAIHGLAHTAETWGPFARALFDDNPTGRKVCRLVAIDLPGHGGSSLPDSIPYGTLTLYDHVQALREVLDRLPEAGLDADGLIGHSQGGLLIQLLQDELRWQGTTLRERFGIKTVVLLAPVPAAPVGWPLADSGAALGILGSFITFDPTLGPIAYIPPPYFSYLFASNLFGEIAPGAPDADTVAALGYDAPEPLYASMMLVGAAPFSRPAVAPGLFAEDSKTRLFLVALEQDVFMAPAVEADLYEYLTGLTDGVGLATVTGRYAVHDLYLTDPEGLLDAVAGSVDLP